MSSKPAAKQAQLRAEQERKRKQRQYLIIGGGIAAAVVILIGVVLLLRPPTGEPPLTSSGNATCDNLLTLEDEGRGHLNPGETPTYKQVPPTSGTHNPVWAQAGVYGDNVDVTQLVHSLEHGYIILYYNGASQQEIQQLINYQAQDPTKMIVAPYPNMPSKIALVAWDHIQRCNGVNTQAIYSFVSQFRNQGPEQAP